MIHLLSLVVPLLSFTLQSYPRFFNRYFGVDVWTRLLEIEHVRKAHHKIPSKIKYESGLDRKADFEEAVKTQVAKLDLPIDVIG